MHAHQREYEAVFIIDILLILMLNYACTRFCVQIIV